MLVAGQIVKRGDKTYLVRVYLGRDPETGKRKYHNKTVHGNKKDAQAYLNKCLREKDVGQFVEPSRMTLNEYLDKWLLESAKQRVRERTFESYERMLRLYIRPGIGDRKVAQLSPLQIQAVYNQMIEEKGLSSRTVRYAHSVLRMALEQGVKWQILSQNPAQYVDLPRQEREEMRPLTINETKNFLQAAANTRFGTLFELLLTTGLRPGEALGLKWADIDLTAGRLQVVRSLADGKFQEPKTSRARRTLPLPASTVSSLKRHKKAQSEERLMADDWEDNDLVFAGEKGQPVYYRNLVRRHFKPLLRKAGLPATVRLYDFRHTAATLLLSAGENPKIVSERLGHASVVITLDTYSHVLPDMQEGAASKIESLIYDKT